MIKLGFVHLEKLLLVEDDNTEAQFATDVIHEASSHIAIVRQTISQTALEYLRQVDISPQLILFDIGLPDKTDGISFIKEMKAIKTLESIPLVILTGIPLDIARAHAANVADEYIMKPIKVARLLELFIKLRLET